MKLYRELPGHEWPRDNDRAVRYQGWLSRVDIDYEAGRAVLAAHQGVHPDRCQGLADAIVDAALGIKEGP